MERMVSVTRDGTYLEQLRTLSLVLAESLDEKGESHSKAQLARQYRETIREIAELEGEDDDGDAIAQLIAKRGA